MRTDGPTTALPAPRSDIVDRRAQYQAKVRNAGLHLQPEFRLREIRGKRVKAALGVLALAAVSRRAAAALQQLDWTPTHPRPDAPPRKPGSAAA
jgi:hypothetical protein